MRRRVVRGYSVICLLLLPSFAGFGIPAGLAADELEPYPDASGGTRSSAQFQVSIDSIGGAIANVETLSTNGLFQGQAGIYRPESFFATPAGAVPDGGAITGVPLSVAVTGGSLTLSWGASCKVSDFDYAVYEGTLGTWYSHTLKACSTGGATTSTFSLPAGNTYYLVVPENSGNEGSYGQRSDATERPPGTAECLPQYLGPCP